MISWLQTNLQKHFRVVFIVLLVVIVIAFVFTIGNQGSFSGTGAQADLRFFGVPLATQTEQARFQQDARLSAVFKGNMRSSSTYPFERATALHVADLHDVPAPSGEEFEEYLKSQPIFQGPQGQFDPQAYSMMLDNLKLGMGVSDADIRRVLEQDYRMEKTYSVLEGAGFVDKSAVLEALRRRGTEWSVMVANYNPGSYNPQIDVTEEELRSYYEENQLQYQTPVRRSVDYVEFDAATYLDQVKPTEDELINYFEENRSRYQPEPPAPAEEGEEPAPQEPVTFEEVRADVRADLRMDRARDIAFERANDLVLQIIENEIPNDSAALESAIEDHQVVEKTTPHFARGETPIGTTWGQQAVNEAFSLNQGGRYYSEPVQVGNKSVVLFYNDQIESVVPDFETVRDRVAADYRAQRANELQAEHVRQLRETLVEAAEGEESFGAAAEANGFAVQTYRDFTAAEPPEAFNPRLFSALFDLDESEVSELIPTGPQNSAAYLYVLEKEVPEVSADDEEYAQLLPMIRNQYRRAAAQQYITELMLEEGARQNLSFALN